MVTPLSISSGNNVKVLYFPKQKVVTESVQKFLKELGIKRDYRKDFLRSFRTDTYDETSTKDGKIVISAFIGTKKIILRISYHEDKLDFVNEVVTTNF